MNIPIPEQWRELVEAEAETMGITPDELMIRLANVEARRQCGGDFIGDDE